MITEDDVKRHGWGLSYKGNKFFYKRAFPVIEKCQTLESDTAFEKV